MALPKTIQQKTSAVLYCRVSTRRQGETGNGLKAQREAAGAYADRAGLEIVGEFIEVESGRSRTRPILQQAIAAARKNNARLVVAKNDRLGRGASFLLALRDSGVDFVAADNPDIGPLVVGILAVIAQDEAERIRTRIREALAQVKKHKKLGSPQNLTAEGRRQGPIRIRQNATDAYRPLANYIAMMHKSGMSLRAIADRLNSDGYRTRGNTMRPPGKFYAATVSRMLKRSEAR